MENCVHDRSDCHQWARVWCDCVRFVVAGTRPFSPRPPLSLAYIAYFSLTLVGVLCFVKGLDDKHDELRMWHGLWHFFAGLAAYFLCLSEQRSSAYPIAIKEKAI